MSKTSDRRPQGQKPDAGGLQAKFNQGLALHQQGRLADAERIYLEVLQRQPDHFDALHLSGVLAVQSGRTEQGVGLIRKAIMSNAKFAAAHNNLGKALLHLNPRDALASCDKAIALLPDFAEAYLNRGDVLQALRRSKEALASYDKAIALRLDVADAYFNRGNALLDLNHSEEALASYDKAIELKPDHADAYNCRGIALQNLMRREEELASYEKAIALRPNYAEAYSNRGNALLNLNRSQEALASFDRAIALRPDYTDAFINRSRVRLLNGDFFDGWREYLKRDSVRSVGISVHRERLSADLCGQRILVLAEQGLGDEMLFLRFAASLKARGATVLYRGSEKIAAMIARSGAVDHVVGPNETPPEFSLTVSVADLPYLLGAASVAEIPPPLALQPLPAALETMAARLGALGPAPYFGVTWRAGVKNTKSGLYKEAPRAALAEALADVPGTLVVLQRLPQDGEVEAFAREAGRPVHDLTALNESLEDMLAIVALIDDYICVSNTNVLLRAGAGRPCRVLIPCPPDFRWMAEGRESPWFPGTRIYRQQPDDDWRAALAALKNDLA